MPQLRARFLVGVLFVAAGSGWHRADATPSAPPAVQLELPSQVVSGLPIPAALRIAGERRVRRSYPLSRLSPVAVRLLDRGALIELPPCDLVLRPGRAADIDPVRASRAPLDVVEAGPTAYQYLDLTELESECAALGPGAASPAAHLAPNAYIVSAEWDGAPVEVPGPGLMVAPANAAEALLVQRLDAVPLRFGQTRWGAFVLNAPAILQGVDLAALSETARRQLQFLLLLQRLVHAPEPVAGLSIADAEVAGMWEVYRPLVRYLRYEILVAKGDAPAAEAVRAEVLAEDPLGADELTAVDLGQGFIARLRGLKRGG